jgi:hypothetical protein
VRIGARVLTAVASLAVAMGPAVAASADVSFGSRVATRNGQSENQAIDAMENAIGREYDSIRIFKLWDDTWPDSHAQWLASQGKTVVLSVKSTRNRGGTVLWRDIVAAQDGSPLYETMQSWATRIRNYPGQVYFAFNHEPEASASSRMGNAEEFKAAYAKFAQIIRDGGATNVKFMWIMTDHAFIVGSNDRRYAAKWYPGDAVVDAIASDSYNWYTCRGRSEPWKSLESIVTPMRNFGAQHPTEELWLAEWGSAEDPAQPGRKGQWFRDAQALFKRPGWEQFEGLVYFNFPGESNCYWFADSSAQSLQGYREMAQDPFYGGPGGEEPPPDGDATVMLVVGNGAAPSAADALVRDRLTAAGHQVAVVDDGAVTVAAANGADAVLVSATVSSTLSARLRPVTSPVLLWKPYVYDDMLMTGTAAGTAYGNVAAQTVAVTSPGHPLAAGLTGTVALYSSSQTVAYGVPGAGATVVGTVGGRAGLFVYPAGARLVGGAVASGCRIGFPAGASSSPALTASGRLLLERAVQYAADGC